MGKKYLGYGIIGFIVAMLVFMFSLNVMAAHEGAIPFQTDKSDRTILKEILINQGKTHALLGEIKVLLQAAK